MYTCDVMSLYFSLWKVLVTPGGQVTELKIPDVFVTSPMNNPNDLVCLEDM